VVMVHCVSCRIHHVDALGAASSRRAYLNGKFL
jgi:hypothetical protein